MSKASRIEKERFRAQARVLYSSDDIQVDHNCPVAVSQSGAFVAAWVFVPRHTLNQEEPVTWNKKPLQR